MGGNQHGFVRRLAALSRGSIPLVRLVPPFALEPASTRGARPPELLGPDLNFHGFLRGPDGKIAVFDAPGADLGGNFNGTFPQSINLWGSITGYYITTDGLHGFVRTFDGHITTFNDPAGTVVTFPTSINALGAIAGEFVDTNNVVHGFVRSPSGAFVTIDAPDAGSVIGSGQGTFCQGINLQGAVTGIYFDKDNGGHGFVWTPPRDKDK